MSTVTCWHGPLATQLYIHQLEINRDVRDDSRKKMLCQWAREMLLVVLEHAILKSHVSAILRHISVVSANHISASRNLRVGRLTI